MQDVGGMLLDYRGHLLDFDRNLMHSGEYLQDICVSLLDHGGHLRNVVEIY